MEPMEMTLGILTGIGLAAACGFRVFVPPLVLSIAAKSGHLQLGDGFEWMASWPALAVFASATLLEIAGYYIPFVDNLLDAVEAPSAVIAGTVVAASQVTEMSPLLTWSLALVAGGGSAGVLQGFTMVTRSASSLATAGFGNPFVSTAEAGASVGLSLLALVFAPLAVLTVLVLLVFAVKKLFFRSPPVEAVP